ncbi:MAG TPA: bacillithiol biosynthesis cysteine-adding enzyme BshC [Gemmatimonadaceae bacterium]|nr:bacillithiol biosynthesis cysteine-adding enzyme BshC [Gemmatimonadaceae bacterium]
MTDFRVLTRALGASALARLALSGDAPEGWYPAVPFSADEWRVRAESVRRDFDGSDWSARLSDAFSASGRAAERLERVARSGGVVVTTGQQPGLFGGPIYTFSKALSALALADALERATGIPTAPVFWAATYDADFAESSVTYAAIGTTVERLQMAAPPVAGLEMCYTPLGDVSVQARILERAAGSAADPAVMELVRSSYAAAATVGSAFVALLRGVLEPLGIAVLDAGHAAVRSAERPLMLRALERAKVIDDSLIAREKELRERGHEPQVAHVDGLSLVFEVKDGLRERIQIGSAQLASNDSSWATLEPNVLLRPVAERAILPTVAYAAGPGELGYFAQVSAVADALGSAQPLALPRWSGVIVEPHVRRILERSGLEVDDLANADATLGRLARELLPDRVRGALAGYRAALERAADELAAAIGEGDAPLVPDAVLTGARNSIGHRLDRLERRVVAASKRRHDQLVRDVETARASLYPLGKPQERMLNLMPMLARHGEPLLEAMLEAAREHAASLVEATLAATGRATEP